MRGETNSAPTGGGLKVIAEGTFSGNQTIDLPAPAKIAYVCVLDEAIAKSQDWAVVTPQQRIASVSSQVQTWFPSPTQFHAASITSYTYYYLVLG